MFRKYFFTLLMAMPLFCRAGYLVAGPIKAEDCYDFGIKICKIKTVTQIKVSGRLLPVTNYFDSVSDYSETKSMCWVNTKSKGLGILSFGINAATQPEFWGYDGDGKFGAIDADFIYFNCVKK